MRQVGVSRGGKISDKVDRRMAWLLLALARGASRPWGLPVRARRVQKRYDRVIALILGVLGLTAAPIFCLFYEMVIVYAAYPDRYANGT